MGAYDEQTMNLSDEEHAAERYSGAFVSATGLAAVGPQPVLGRTLQADDEREGAPPVVVLGWRAWQTRYGGSPDVLGRTVRVNSVRSTVVGVMPEGFGFPTTSEVWRPLSALDRQTKDNRRARRLTGFALLREGITFEQARADLRGVTAALAARYPESDRDIEPRLDAFRSGIGGPFVALFAALTGAVAFVLLIACANIANLLLARAASRAHEVSVRVSMGASRWRIVRQLLIESLVLAGCAGVLGLALSAAAVRIFWSIAAQTHPPYWMRFPIDWRVLAYVTALCLGTSILFGFVPALYTAKTNVFAALTRGITTGRHGKRWSAALVVGELALTLVLLSGAGAMIRNFLMLATSDPGVDTASLVRMRLDLPATTYDTPERRLAFYRRLDERLGSMPGLLASIATTPPASGGTPRAVVVEGRPDAALGSQPIATVVTIGDRYFDTIGAQGVRGRRFAAGDGEIGQGAAIVNERFAAMLFSDRNPIGQRIRLAPPRSTATTGGTEWMTIVGVAPNVQQRPENDGGFDPVVYVPLAANPEWGGNIIVRSSALGLAAAQVQEQLRAIDPDIPLFDVRTVDDLLSYLRWAERVFGSMFAIFAAIALTLASVGLYAVTAYAVAQRTREIGLRIALGAGSRHVWWLVTRSASVQLTIGLTAGLAASVGVLRILPQQVTRTSGDNADTLVLATALLVLIALAACLIPARRALVVDPMRTLRE